MNEENKSELDTVTIKNRGKDSGSRNRKTLKYGINAGSLGKRRLLLPVRCKTWQTPVP